MRMGCLALAPNDFYCPLGDWLAALTDSTKYHHAFSRPGSGVSLFTPLLKD